MFSNMNSIFDSPLFRATVGFDQILDWFDESNPDNPSDSSYPPYNIERMGNNNYRVTLAVAGFKKEEIEISEKSNLLRISAKKENEEQESSEYLHQGIAGRGFVREFRLADGVNVLGANLNDGLLSIDLEKEIPENIQSKKIEIATDAPEKPKISKVKRLDDAKSGVA